MRRRPQERIVVPFCTKLRCVFLVILLYLSLFSYLGYRYYQSSYPPNIKIGFLGDTFLTPALTHFLCDQHLDVLVHLGDLTYLDRPQDPFTDWLRHFPSTFVTPTVGNYDHPDWPFYTSAMSAHNEEVQGSTSKVLHCTGAFGVQGYCQLEGLVVIQLISELHLQSKFPNYTLPNSQYISHVFQQTRSTSSLRVCSFHHPHPSFKLLKPITDLVTLEEYETCRRHGAFIVSGHDHLYARTQAFYDYIEKGYEKEDVMRTLDGFSTIAVISGLGGKSLDKYDEERLGYPWWAVVYPEESKEMVDVYKQESPDPTLVGILVCELDQYKRKVDCNFKTMDGVIRDQFKFTTRP